MWLEVFYYLLFFVGILYLYQLYVYMSTNIPAVFPLPIVGSLYIMGLNTSILRERMISLLDHYGIHGIIHYTIGPFFASVLLMRSDLVQALLTSTKITSKCREYSFFEPWLGDGLLLSKGKKNHEVRKAVLPAFYYGSLITIGKIINKLSDNLDKKWIGKSSGEDVRVDFDIELWALDIIFHSAMGVNVNALSLEREETSMYIHSINELMRLIWVRTLSIMKRVDWYFYWTNDGRSFKQCLKIINKEADYVISARRKILQEIKKANEEEQSMGFQHDDKKNQMNFLDTLLLSKKSNGEPFTDAEIRDEFNTFILGGYDTASTAVGFMMYELSQNPEVQEKVYQEIMDVCGEESNITMTHVQELKYVEMVIKETLRLHTVLSMVGRRVDEDVQLGEYLLKKNTTVGVPIFYIHLMPEYFENPRQFIPERFLTDQQLPFTFIPFSFGPRNCVGQKFAMLEMKIVIVKILKHFQLMPASAPAPAQPVNFIMKPLNGIYVRFRKRDQY